MVLKNESVCKLAELSGLESLDLSGDNVTATGQQHCGLESLMSVPTDVGSHSISG